MILLAGLILILAVRLLKFCPFRIIFADRPHRTLAFAEMAIHETGRTPGGLPRLGIFGQEVAYEDVLGTFTTNFRPMTAAPAPQPDLVRRLAAQVISRCVRSHSCR